MLNIGSLFLFKERRWILLILKILSLICAGLVGLLSFLHIIPWTTAFPIISILIGFVFGSEAEKRSNGGGE